MGNLGRFAKKMGFVQNILILMGYTGIEVRGKGCLFILTLLACVVYKAVFFVMEDESCISCIL